jgi:hypothetical protein
MSKELINITDDIMDQIHDEKIKMRPKIYFILGSTLIFVGLVASVITSVFLVGLIRFFLRSHGPMANYRFDQIVSSFPWWIPVFAIIGLIVGLWLLRKYDFYFKIDYKIAIIGFILAIIVGGLVVDVVGINDALIRRGPMRGMMRQYMEENNIQDVRSSPNWSKILWK